MDQILEGATRAVEKFGTDFTMDYLSKTLHISKRTIYEHYSSKEELIAHIFEIKLDEILKKHQELLLDPTKSLEEKLVEYFTLQSDTFNTMGTDHVRSILEKMPTVMEKASTNIQRDWQLLFTFLQQEVEKGHIRDVSIENIIYLLQTVSCSIFNDGKFESFDDMDRFLEQLIQMILKGIEK